MTINKLMFTLILLGFIIHKCYPCKCPEISIEREIRRNKAYDFVVGKIISKKSIPINGKYELWGPVSYKLSVEFSYMGNIAKGNISVIGGNGWGDCGAIFKAGKYYLVVITKSNSRFYSEMCYANSMLAEASHEIMYLNKYYHKKYNLLKINFLIITVFLQLFIFLPAIILVFDSYKVRSGRGCKMRRKLRNLPRQNLLPRINGTIY